MQMPLVLLLEPGRICLESHSLLDDLSFAVGDPRKIPFILFDHLLAQILNGTQEEGFFLVGRVPWMPFAESGDKQVPGKSSHSALPRLLLKPSNLLLEPLVTH